MNNKPALTHTQRARRIPGARLLVAAVISLLPVVALAMDNMPTRGQTMDQVRSTLGEPTGVKGPVGTPAITTWEYSGFCVYFENNMVITSVKN